MKSKNICCTEAALIVCLCVCLEYGYHDNKQSILVTNCGGGWLEGVCAGSVYMHATACINV